MNIVLWVCFSGPFTSYTNNASLVHIAGSKLESFTVGVGHHQGCLVLQILFITFIDNFPVQPEVRCGPVQ